MGLVAISNEILIVGLVLSSGNGSVKIFVVSADLFDVIFTTNSIISDVSIKQRRNW